jgi:tetratricopeptide (TPR) repeat protein
VVELQRQRATSTVEGVGSDDTERYDVVRTLPHSHRLQAVPPDVDSPSATKHLGDEVLPLPRPAPGAPPERIGGYRILRELGRGGAGIVYLAESLTLGRQVALKVLGEQGGTEAVDRFLLEARAIAKLRHPNIVGVHEAGEDGALRFLALELVEGESLRARVTRDGALAPREAVALLEPVARALQHAHAAGLLHRDVKSGNVLVDEDGTPRLADFGLAKDVAVDGLLTVTGAVMGTPPYMAPEQAAADHARVDRRADVYGLGATLYEALTGVPPFAGGTALATIRRVCDEPPRPPSQLRPGLDRDLEAICLTCLEKAPADRYDTAGELADDLARWLRHEPVSVRQPNLPGRALRWARRHPGLAANLGTLAVGLLVAGSVAGALDLAARRRTREARRAAQAAATVAAAASGGDADALAARATDARAAARRWVEMAPGDEEALAALADGAAREGEALRALRQYGSAHVAFAEAARLRPERNDLTRAALACLRLQQAEQLRITRRLEDALECCAQALAARPDWPDPWLAQVTLHELDGDAPSAVYALDEALKLAPDDVGALQLRAYRLATAGDPAGALRDLDRTLALHPELAHAYVQRAALRRLTKDHAGALSDLERAMALAPGGSGPLLLRGQLRADLRDFEGAEADLEAATRVRPNDARLWAQLGLVRLERGAPRNAVFDALDRAVALAPDFVQSRVARSQALQRFGDLRGALQDMEAVTRHDPRNLSALLQLGHLEAMLGDLAAAERDFDRVAQASAQPGAQTSGDCALLALLGRAEVRLVRSDFAGARDDAAAALRLAPRSPDGLRVRGLALLKLDGDGVPDLERFLQVVPADHPRAAEVRAVIERVRQQRGR